MTTEAMKAQGPVDVLVGRLRVAATKLGRSDEWEDLRDDLHHAAAEIERLRAAETEMLGALDAAKSAAAIAWGWLWHVTTADDRVKTARHMLGQMLDKDLKRYGIQTAKAEGAQVNVQEIEAAMLRGEFGAA